MTVLNADGRPTNDPEWKLARLNEAHAKAAGLRPVIESFANFSRSNPIVWILGDDGRPDFKRGPYTEAQSQKGSP